MKNILIFCMEAFGDTLISTHLGTLYKQKYPDCNIFMTVRPYMNLTTSANQEEGLEEILDIIELQPGVDGVGFLLPDGIYRHKRGKVLQEQPDLTIIEKEWFSDLGLVGSHIVPFYATPEKPFVKRESMDTNLVFSVGEEKKLPEKLTIATQGPFEWGRKINGEETQKEVVAELKKYADVLELDVKTHKGTYLDALKQVNNCHLFIGPIGSMAHAAAGLGVDTINITSVFPPEYDSPEFYMKTGKHLTISPNKKNHCGDYKCITPKNFDPQTYNKSYGNPKTEWDFWTHECSYMPNNKSCLTYYTTKQILDKFYEWYETWT